MISCHKPSLNTRDLTASSFFRAARALAALYSCQNPTAALKASRAVMITKSGQCLSAADSMAAISIIHGMGPQKYPMRRFSVPTLCSSKALSPNLASLCRASAEVRPPLPLLILSKSLSDTAFAPELLPFEIRISGIAAPFWTAFNLTVNKLIFRLQINILFIYFIYLKFITTLPRFQ